MKIFFFNLIAGLLIFSCSPAKALETPSTPVFQMQNTMGIQEIQENLIDIGKNHASSVVYISTLKTIVEESVSPFDFFYGTPFGRGTPQQQREHQQSGLGSGVIYRRNGNKVYIVTNNHVIEGSDEVHVSVNEGKSYDAKVLGADPAVDIAVLEISTEDVLPTALIADSSKISPGEFAIAVGNPFGLKNTITFGIISAVGRDNISSGKLSLTDFIQTDAAINPGNSGGPLLNIEGEVIGINTMIYSQNGGNIGIGFAVPVNIVRNIADQIIDTGMIKRGYLGISYKALDPEDLEKLGLKNIENGMLVSQIVKDSPAEKHGMKTGDVIVQADEKKLEDSNDLARIVGNKKPGDTMILDVVRDRTTISIQVILGAKEDVQKSVKNQKALVEDLGLELSQANSSIKELYNIPLESEGLVVTDVVPYSRAAQQGIKKGDLIYKVNNRRISSVEELNQILKKNEGINYFYVKRDGIDSIIMM